VRHAKRGEKGDETCDGKGGGELMHEHYMIALLMRRKREKDQDRLVNGKRGRKKGNAVVVQTEKLFSGEKKGKGLKIERRERHIVICLKKKRGEKSTSLG